MIRLHRSILLASLLVLSFAPVPDDAESTARLENAMQAGGLGFQRSATGLSFQVPFTNDADRGQTVNVAIQPSRLGELVMHAVYTTVWTSATEPPNEATLHQVLGTSKKLGEFYLYQDSSGPWSIRFGTAFDATELPDVSLEGSRPARRLADTIRFVNEVGEELDVLLNGARDHR